MLVRSLDLDHFRNYETLHLEFDKGIHIFYGENAQGKTNILESIYLSSSNKSHRGSKDKEMINFNSEESHIKMIFDKRDIEYRIDLHLRKNKNKGIAINKVPIKKAADFIGFLNCIFFSPEDLQIVKEGPQERRKFIDNELCQLDKIYLNNFIYYKKALDERNSLLKDLYFHPELLDTLDVWDQQLVKYGKEIISIRSRFIKDLNHYSKTIHEKISGGKEQLNLYYEPNTTIDEFEKELRMSRSHDMKLKSTSIGPHRDDISFIIQEEGKNMPIDARIYGSQGQQRTCALSVKLAEIDLVKERINDTPVLLLDDVLSELDSNRQNYLLDSINEIQTFITCTGLEDFVVHRNKINSIYKVANGVVQNGE